MKFKQLTLLVFLALVMGCKENIEAIEEAQDTIVPADLIGKTIEYVYGESIYHVTIDNDEEMHWEAMAGEEKGTYEEETYKIESIDDMKLFITWGEANGIGVSQVLDFEKGIVYNHLLRGRDVSIGQGKVRILE